tara:strand:+ start:6737 stop:7837 length:1101 start_codon:yes stop_codon:yes gene_type:complete
MSQGWLSKKLKDVCVMQRGFDLPKKDRRSGNFPLISSSGAIDFHAEAKVTGPGVVTGRSGSIGQVFFIEEDFWPLNTSLYIKEFHGNDPRFIYYLLKSFDLSRYTSGAGVPTLNRNHVHDEDVLIPLDIEEQKRIVAILDQAFSDIDKARALTEKNLKNARELFESYLRKVFSQRGERWVDSTLANVAENLDRKRIPITKKDRVEGEYPYYGASGIVDYVNHYIFDEELLLVSEDGANLLARTYPVAFTATGKYWVNNHAHVLRFKDSFIQKFIEYYLNSISLRPYVSGMAQPKLNQKALNSIPVPSVDSVIAKNVVGRLSALEDELNRVQKIYKAKLDRLDELKKSLFQKAFAGELTKDSEESAA